MSAAYVLINPKAGKGCTGAELEALEVLLPLPVKKTDITAIEDWETFLAALDPEDWLVVAGGDGTLNHFVNDTCGLPLPEEVWYWPIGTGNDFAREFSREAGDTPVRIRQHLDRLPTVEVNGKTCRFLNGIGFGIDGYCTAEGDRLRSRGEKKINYTAIAIRGLLGGYQPTAASVTVDGKTYRYESVWLAPTMLGKYYGGGMIPTPGQDRRENTLSVLVFHDSGKLRTLTIFPGIFKGKHIRHKRHVQVLRGRDIKVEFREPRPLQIDGETIPEVRSYRAWR